MTFPEGSYCPSDSYYPVAQALYRFLRGSIYSTTDGRTYVLSESGWSRVWPVFKYKTRGDIALRMFLQPPNYSIRADGSQALGVHIYVALGDPMEKRAREIRSRANRPSLWQHLEQD